MNNNVFLILIIAVNIALGFAIRFSNPKRNQNRMFFILTISLATWMFCVWGIMNATTESAANILIRIATAIVVSFPLQLRVLLQLTQFPEKDARSLVHSNRYIIILSLVCVCLCFSPWFMRGVIVPSPLHPEINVPEADYGIGFPIVAAYLFAALIYAISSAVWTTSKISGMRKVESQYVLLGCGAMLICGFSTSLIIPLITHNTQVQQYGPVSVVVMAIIIAYGIATKKILDVHTVIRKALAYTFLVLWMLMAYLVVLYAAQEILALLSIVSDLSAQIIATLTVALTTAPMRTKMQEITSKLIISHSMDVPSVMKRASDAFQNVTTRNSLLQQFSSLLKDELGTSQLSVLVADGTDYIQCFPQSIGEYRNIIPTDSPVVEMIIKDREPLCTYSLSRSRQTPEIQAVYQVLDECKAVIAIGYFSQSRLLGIILMGEKESGRIYDKVEQDALQILCNQFAVALENATLYTEMQDSKIRNDILLSQLVNGVIVADLDRRVSLFNREAERIVGLPVARIMGGSIGMLPISIRRILEKTLSRRTGERSADAVLFPNKDEHVPVRMGSTFLFGHDGRPMGALLVFTDLTELKKLESQVRRNDQLSSVGTLAAGMAHEIKNPLVTIKTFAQLLPNRFADEDFRAEFSGLVGSEIGRIDSIVNQLLHFSKPVSPILKPLQLHETVEKAIGLASQKASQQRIELRNECDATNDSISGDDDLLTQVMINLLLNAIDAIGEHGDVVLTTTNCMYTIVDPHDMDTAEERQCICLKVKDSGKGIPADKLNKVFDPFFTSKSEGTGMGLSVVHGIIQEHHGTVEVTSEVGTGTTFSLYLPLLLEEVVE